ncbi:unnamed protein product [Spirodela intermedia]|uniref:Uncharacterized protein n=1 Tax=Spirodela intermedia TaxID=51605 RepID=A0A7I8JIB9_SPIIN|nr:unnamed protein product [Spirodela intermedia]CAA6669899.1 unnamed protein product [Spirodela intermedia]
MTTVTYLYIYIQNPWTLKPFEEMTRAQLCDLGSCFSTSF